MKKEKNSKENKTKKKRKRLIKLSLAKKIFLGLIGLSMLLVISISLFVSANYSKRTNEKYQYIGYSITRTTASMINGDKVLNYGETKEPDDYYYKILAYMRKTKQNFGVKYLYVIIPRDDYFIYIWDVSETDPKNVIGVTAPYGNVMGQDYTKRVMTEDVPPEKIIKYKDISDGELASAVSPVYDSNGNRVAVVCCDIDQNDYYVEAIDMFLRIFFASILIMGLPMLFYYLNISKNFIFPVKVLTKATSDLVENIDKGAAYVSNIHTGDEIEALSESFEKMDEELKEYISLNEEITSEKKRIEAELDMASSIQASQLPNIFPPFPERTEFDIYATMTPAKEVGGDFYDFFMIDKDHIALVMADVSGKGVPAALFMMISKILIKTHVQNGESPGEAIANVNNQLLENNEEEFFVTVWLAVINLKTGKGVSVNAGHEHPVIRRAGGEYELDKYRHSPVVAAMEDIPFKEREFELHPGDSIFVYTDGVAEATSPDLELYGTDRLLEALNKNPEAESKEILESVKNSIDEFVSGAEQFDDITMLSFVYKGV